MAKRGDTLELAVLGLLHETPLHGYELRKRLNILLGWGRLLSYGSLYPCLKQLVRRGWIEEDLPVRVPLKAPAPAGRRARIVYRLTDAGSAAFVEMVSQTGPAAWEDGSFDIRFAFFARTDVETRMRVLEGRRARLEERLDRARTGLDRPRGGRIDAYVAELQRHSVESMEHEVAWLSGLIDGERRRGTEPVVAAAEEAQVDEQVSEKTAPKRANSDGHSSPIADSAQK